MIEDIKKYNNKFVHLHVHTEYSLLDGSAKIINLINKAKELGMKSLAITDHGVMYGCVEFYKEAIKRGIKPIIGCEVYVAQKSMNLKSNNKENNTYHLVLLVKNETGYRNLMKIVSKASIDGFYYKPRIDHEYLKKYNEGIIALSACLGGEIQSYILQGNKDKAKDIALLYKNIFKDGFYLELQYHGMEEQVKVNKELIQLSKELNIPLVATNDVHYIQQKDAKSHDVLLCIQTSKKIQDEDRMRYPSDQFYLKSYEEMYESFSYVPEALENTVKIADECNFDYEFHKSRLPKFPLEDNIDPYKYLKDLCYKGLKDKYKEISEDIIERLEYELGVIKQMGYVNYFLIVWDFIRYARENDIMTGPGRGSGAGSIVAYTLGITKIDPIKYNLIFERFLNPERVSMPDIDSDFCYERRGEVIDYVIRKYGVDNVSQIITFGTMAARACIRDVGRAMDYSYGEVDKIAKMIPSVLNITIDKALDMNPDLNNIYKEDIKIRELIDVARDLEGLPRHTSTHAAGVVIASEPLVNFVPLQKNDDVIVSQFTMGNLEELGLLKMDFLGLRTLTVMRDAVKIIKENKGITIDLDNINFSDKNVYNMVGKGNTIGVFQLESTGMISFMKELKPDCLEDIIAGISLYRPGPMSEIPTYIKNKKNPENIKYEVPQLEPILKVTYGCMVYQEQVMQIVRDLAGYSMGRSDLVRRAMSKKKHKVMEEERKNFIYGIVDEKGNIEVPGCIRNGISEKSANKLFDSMIDFASYAFNKSHAAAYAVIAFQTAYLMHYYTTEFIASMLNSVKGNSEKVSFYIRFSNSKGIKILPPDINKSYGKFTVEDNKIRFGLAAIKNVGENAIKNIVEVRKEKKYFENLEDFLNKVNLSYINKRCVESLIKAGAFDCFNIYRSKMLAVYEKILDSINNSKRKNLEGQISLFTNFKDNKISFEYPDIKEFEKRYLLSMEKEMIGVYLSGHPLQEYEDVLNRKTSIRISNIINSSLNNNLMDDSLKIKDGAKVKIGGIVNTINKKITKNNNIMCFINIEDLYGEIEIIVFPTTYQKYKNILFEDKLLIIEGRLNFQDNEKPKIICESIIPLLNDNIQKIYILIENQKLVNKVVKELKPIFFNYKGENPIYICTRKERKKFKLNKDLWINKEEEIIDFLKNKFGDNNIKVI